MNKEIIIKGNDFYVKQGEKVKANKYKDIKLIIDILAQTEGLGDDEFGHLKKLILKMANISEKHIKDYVEGK